VHTMEKSWKRPLPAEPPLVPRHAPQRLQHKSSMDHVAIVTLPNAGTSASAHAETDVHAGADEGATTDPSDAAQASSSNNGKKPMKRMTLNDAQKYEVCRYMKDEEEQSGRLTNKALVAYILERFGIKVDESTVSRLRQQSGDRLSRSLSNPGRRRNRDVAFPELERRLEEYIQAMKRKVAINDPMIVNKGKELRAELGIAEEQMKFSDGWLNKFKVRHGLKSQAVDKAPRSNGTTKRRTRSGRLSGDRSDQSGSMIALPGQGAMDLTIDSLHDDHSLDMDLGAGMDVDHSESSQSLQMARVLREQLSSHSADISANSEPVIPMDLLSNVYGNALAPIVTASPEHSRQQTSQAIAPKPTHRASHKAGHRSGGSRAPQMDSVITNSLAGLGLSTAVPAASSSQLVPGTSSTNSGDGLASSRSAARDFLSKRLADPIAAAFEPEPTVDFEEARRCVDILRIFMQQRNFSREQLGYLNDIYMDMKHKQQHQPQL